MFTLLRNRSSKMNSKEIKLIGPFFYLLLITDVRY